MWFMFISNSLTWNWIIPFYIQRFSGRFSLNFKNLFVFYRSTAYELVKEFISDTFPDKRPNDKTLRGHKSRLEQTLNCFFFIINLKSRRYDFLITRKSSVSHINHKIVSPTFNSTFGNKSPSKWILKGFLHFFFHQRQSQSWPLSNALVPLPPNTINISFHHITHANWFGNSLNSKKATRALLHNRCQLLERLVLVEIRLVRTGNHVYDNVWMVFSSSWAVMQVSIRLTRVIVIDVV